MRKLALVMVLALTTVPAALEAQACAGQAPWSSGRMKVGGSLEFGDGVTDILGGVAVGKDQGYIFAGRGGFVTGHGDTGFELGGTVGKELTRKIADKIAICPVINADLVFSYFDVTTQQITGGLVGAYPFETGGDVGVSIVGGAYAGFAHSSISNDACTIIDCSSTDFVLHLDAGAGIVFNRRISLVPLLRIPLEPGGDVRFFIGANVALGK
jgi:hypothetical protein